MPTHHTHRDAEWEQIWSLAIEARQPDFRSFIGHECRAIATMTGYWDSERRKPRRVRHGNAVTCARQHKKVNIDRVEAVKDRTLRLHAAGGNIGPRVAPGMTAPAGSDD